MKQRFHEQPSTYIACLVGVYRDYHDRFLYDPHHFILHHHLSFKASEEQRLRKSRIRQLKRKFIRQHTRNAHNLDVLFKFDVRLHQIRKFLNVSTLITHNWTRTSTDIVVRMCYFRANKYMSQVINDCLPRRIPVQSLAFLTPVDLIIWYIISVCAVTYISWKKSLLVSLSELRFSYWIPIGIMLCIHREHTYKAQW
jgi:hypothetical protein